MHKILYGSGLGYFGRTAGFSGNALGIPRNGPEISRIGLGIHGKQTGFYGRAMGFARNGLEIRGRVLGLFGRDAGTGGSMRQFPATAWEWPASLQKFSAGFGEAGGKLRERGAIVGECAPLTGRPGTILNALAAGSAVTPCFAKTQGDVHGHNHASAQAFLALQKLSKAHRGLVNFSRRWWRNPGGQGTPLPAQSQSPPPASQGIAVSEWDKIKISDSGEILVNKKQVSPAEFATECQRLTQAGGSAIIYTGEGEHIIKPAQLDAVHQLVGAGVPMKVARKESEVD